MMAARRTQIVTQTIYTEAGRLKGMRKEKAGHTEGHLVEGPRCVCSKCCRRHSMSQRLYVYKQLTLLFRGVADWSSASVHQDLAVSVSAESHFLLLTLQNLF